MSVQSVIAQCCCQANKQVRSDTYFPKESLLALVSRVSVSLAICLPKESLLALVSRMFVYLPVMTYVRLVWLVIIF